MSLFSQLEHLQQKYQELQREYDYLSEYIRCLNDDYHDTIAKSEKLHFKRKREQAEQDREVIEEKMNFLDSQMARHPAQMVFEQLLHIDYVDHIQRFDELLEQANYGAFVLHGQTKNGLFLLLKRLQQYVSVRNVNLSFPIKINLSSLQKLNYCGSYETFDTRLLWKKIGERLQCRNSPEEVAAKLCQKHQEQNVILIFEELDITIDFQVILDDFWATLRTAIQTTACRTSNVLLLLFTVQDEGFWNDEEPAFPDKYHTLPEVVSYARHDVENWIQFICQQFPFYRKHYSPEILHDIFGQQKAAQTDLVIEHLCTNLCKCKFNQGVLQEWLRI